MTPLFTGLSWALIGVVVWVIEYRRRRWLPPYRAHICGPLQLLGSGLAGFSKCPFDSIYWLALIPCALSWGVFIWNTRTIYKTIISELDQAFDSGDIRQISAFMKRWRGES